MVFDLWAETVARLGVSGLHGEEDLSHLVAAEPERFLVVFLHVQEEMEVRQPLQQA
jgi:hypothetical protein